MIDSHSHLFFDRFDDDRDEALARAADVGVEAHIMVGIDVDSSYQALSMAKAYPTVHATAGIHPNGAAETSEDEWSQIEQMLASGEFVAVGETGLDFFRDRTPRDKQEKALSRQIEMARRYNLPLIIHCRDAQDALLDQLEAEAKGVAGVMHCFSGGLDDLARALSIGFDISFAGPLTYPRNEELRLACAETPIDRIHIETDCPFLPPQGKRGKRNEPAFMTALLKTVAECVGMTVAEMNRITALNTRRLFSLDAPIKAR